MATSAAARLQRTPAPVRAAPAPNDPLARLPVVRVGGLAIAALSRVDLAARITACALARRRLPRRPYYFTSANGNVLSRAARLPAFRALVENADVIDADGQPLVAASRWLTRTPIPERCATTDFFHDVARAAERDGLSFYLLGGSEEINRAAAENARALYPGLVIAGRRNGYFRIEEEGEIVAAVNAAEPDILWVGLGVPNEQQFVVRNRQKLAGVGVIRTCGGLFDFVAGRNARAPQWMQDWSLEWVYRLWLEPRRLFWRYAVTNAHALYLLAARTGGRARAGR
jgi:exopolysaccharide biosynthesis WecB/TagA/CpsF family protein